MALPDSGTGRHRTVLLTGDADAPWELVAIRVRDRAGAHLLSSTLDAELAAGAPASTGRLRSVRAAMLVDPGRRRRLARGWLGVLRPGRAIIPVRRSEVLAAADDIHELAGALGSSGPVAPRGVALANLLLTDGTGPLYNPRTDLDLRDQIRLAIQHLHPLGASRL